MNNITIKEKTMKTVNENIENVEIKKLGKSVDLNYYFKKDGKTVVESLTSDDYGFSDEEFSLLMKLAKEPHEGMTDFAYLKEKEPQLYLRVFYDVDVWANNLHIAKEGVQVKVELREFPSQVYEALDEE